MEEYGNGGVMEMEQEIHHPYAFHVCGPHHLSSPTWQHLVSSWKDGNYKRTVMACFIQATYLLELDRQENRTQQTALAPNWWLPFKYKLIRTLIDDRDGSIFGAILEWDRSAALADFILIKPSDAPKAVLALRGTLLKTCTIRRDVEDDFRYLAWESLKGSVRFKIASEALKSIANQYGGCNVCIAGHSLGAGFALQVGKALAKEGIYVEAHLFNPPSVSLAMSVKSIGEKAIFAWKRVRAMLPPSRNETLALTTDEKHKVSSLVSNRWVPHLYVNDSDYVCCYYTKPPNSNAGEGSDKNKENYVATSNATTIVGAKLFVLSKTNQKFLEAHRLEQWWADDLEVQTTINSSKLISRQLKSLYQLPANSQSGPGR